MNWYGAKGMKEESRAEQREEERHTSHSLLSCREMSLLSDEKNACRPMRSHFGAPLDAVMQREVRLASRNTDEL